MICRDNLQQTVMDNLLTEMVLAIAKAAMHTCEATVAFRSSWSALASFSDAT
jgi:hypothetical protein